MESTHPLVSVGIPTYNRPDGLKRTLECMLAQTYANLEIIVSDNASPNKDVEKIARDFATRDTRVSFYRQKENHGPTFNFAFVLQKANGEYFVWAADDDEWETTFISKCVEALRKYPEAILSFPWSILTDKTGKKLEVFKEDIDTHGLSRILRIRKVLQNLSRNTSFYGVFKRSALYKEKMPQHYGGVIFI
jgi:glycosyltransferase involved in cell wall biosynthesis